MLKSFLKSLFIHIALAVLVVFAYLSPTAIKKPSKKPIAISFSVPNPTKDETTVKKETNEEVKPKRLPLEAKKTPVEQKPQEAQVKEVVPEKSIQAKAKPQTATSDIMPPVKSSVPTQSISTIEPTHESTPTVPMQKSANTQPEASPEVYGSMGLDSYYYNKPMEAFSPLRTTKSPAKKPQQQYIVKHSMQSSPKIPMQKSSMILTQSVPTITVSIIKNMNADTIPLETAPNTIESAYVQGIQQTIEQSKTYPEEAQAGTVKITFRIAKDGTLIKTETIEPSGSEVLDTAGAVLLKKIEKFQPIPDSLKKEFMDIILNLKYQ